MGLSREVLKELLCYLYLATIRFLFCYLRLESTRIIKGLHVPRRAYKRYSAIAAMLAEIPGLGSSLSWQAPGSYNQQRFEQCIMRRRLVGGSSAVELCLGRASASIAARSSKQQRQIMTVMYILERNIRSPKLSSQLPTVDRH